MKAFALTLAVLLASNVVVCAAADVAKKEVTEAAATEETVPADKATAAK